MICVVEKNEVHDDGVIDNINDVGCVDNVMVFNDGVFNWSQHDNTVLYVPPSTNANAERVFLNSFSPLFSSKGDCFPYDQGHEPSLSTGAISTPNVVGMCISTPDVVGMCKRNDVGMGIATGDVNDVDDVLDRGIKVGSGCSDSIVDELVISNCCAFFDELIRIHDNYAYKVDMEHKRLNTSKEGNADTVLSAETFLEYDTFKTNVAHINIQGFGRKKVDSVVRYLTLQSVDIFGVTEHWQRYKSQLPKIPGYNHWSNIRSTKLHGGVALYIRNSWKASKLSFPTVEPDIEEEQLWISIIHNNIKLAVCVVYRSPNSLDQLVRTLLALRERVEKSIQWGFAIIIMGDFNVKPQNDNGQANQDSILFNQFLEDLDLNVVNNSKECIGKYTRVPHNSTSPSTLDYICISKDFEVKKAVIDEHREAMIESDHVVISAQLTSEKGEVDQNFYSTMVWNKINDDNLGDFYDEVNRIIREENIFIDECTNDSFLRFRDALQKAALTAIGKKEIKQNMKYKWNDSKNLFELRLKLKRKRAQLRHQKTLCDNNDQVIGKLAAEVWELRMAIKEMEHIERQIRNTQMSNQICEPGQKGMMQLYRYMKSMRRTPPEKFTLKKDDGNLAINDNEVKTLLHNQLKKIFNPQFWPRAELTPPDPSLKLSKACVKELQTKFTASELDIAINSLRNGSSPGPSDIPPEILKSLPEVAKEKLLQLCNVMWVAGEVPACADICSMICLHKKGPTDTLNNYRTLATGCNLLKVYLKMLTYRLQGAAESEGLLGNIQHGFRAGFRAAENILILETGIIQMKRAKKDMYVALLDITKAYDRVCRDSLWFKLESYGFPQRVMTSLKALYANPRGILSFQKVLSDEISIPIGLRQGCVLSPILFALYIADLGRTLETSGLGIQMNGCTVPGMFFADDMVLWGDESNLNKILDVVGDYADNWKIEFAGNKSMVIPYNRKVDPEKKWYLGHYPIVEKQDERIVMGESEDGKYLGVTFHRKHNIYSNHLNECKKKAVTCSHTIRDHSTSTLNPLVMCRRTWSTYGIPTFTYGIEATGFSEGYINDLEKIQVAFLRSVLHMPMYCAKAALYSISGVMPLKYHILRNRLNLRSFIKKLPEERWSKHALHQQLLWTQEDGIINDQGELMDNWKGGISYYMKELYRSLRGQDMRALHLDSKPDVRLFVRGLYFREMGRTINSKSSLEFFDHKSDIADYDFNSLRQNWWLKAKCGALLLNYRKERSVEKKLCPFQCGVEESSEHFFWECVYSNNRLRELTPPSVGRSSKELTRWWLNLDRTPDERALANKEIKKRWDKRNSLLEERRNVINQ